MYRKTLLDNRLKIITHRMSGMQSAAVGIWIKTGGRYENEENKGISHYLEHLLFKGSKKYSCRKIKESIEGVGGSLNGFTSEELTCYLTKLPARHLDLAMDVLSDMVINPALEESEMEKERTVILEELKMYRDLPQSYVHELLDELMWPKHPLGTSIIGSVDSIKRMTRQDIASYKKNYYIPSQIVVSAVGNLGHEKFVGRIKKAFAHLENTKPQGFSPVIDGQASPQINIFSKDTEQTHLALGFHGFKRGHPLRHALGLLYIILGANMSSRLFNEVREKRGLAYEIGAQLKRFYDTGAFLVHAGMDNLKVTEAITIILQELYKTKTTLVTPDEFRRAKEFYLGQLMLALEDTMDYMLWLGEFLATLDKTYTLKEVIREIQQVSRQDIRKVAVEIFKPQDLSLALIGPLKDQEEKIHQIVYLK